MPLTEKDYQEALKDVDRLVRELDVIWNGEAGAAKQASLCDIVGQLRKEVPKLRDDLKRCRDDMDYFCKRVEAGTIHSRTTYAKFKKTLQETK